MKEFIREKAKEIGFIKIGFSSPSCVEESVKNSFEKYLHNNFFGDMEYLLKNKEKTLDPFKLFPPVGTIISLAINYYSEIPYNFPFSRYLTNRDYHDVIREKLKKLVNEIKKEIGDFRYRIFVDSGPILEKYWAWKAGLGWIGKNTLLITEDYGSFIFLGEILIDKKIEPDISGKDGCGDCRKCIDSCPSGAIIKERIIDARKCISYLTIEKKKPLTEEEKKIIGEKIFGCDICQEVCPYNKKMKETEDENLKFPQFLKIMKIHEIKKLTINELKKILKGTSFERKKF